MRKGAQSQSRRHIHIYDEDWEWLLKHFGPESPERFGTSKAVRNIIHAFVKASKARQQTAIDAAADKRQTVEAITNQN